VEHLYPASSCSACDEARVVQSDESVVVVVFSVNHLDYFTHLIHIVIDNVLAS